MEFKIGDLFEVEEFPELSKLRDLKNRIRSIDRTIEFYLFAYKFGYYKMLIRCNPNRLDHKKLFCEIILEELTEIIAYITDCQDDIQELKRGFK